MRYGEPSYIDHLNIQARLDAGILTDKTFHSRNPFGEHNPSHFQSQMIFAIFKCEYTVHMARSVETTMNVILNNSRHIISPMGRLVWPGRQVNSIDG